MLSRVANSICWMARYMERTNGMLRLLHTNYVSSQDEVSDFSWRSVLHITKEVWQCLNDYHHLIRDQQIHNQIKYGDPVTALDALIRHGMLYHGTVDITMARGEGK